MRRIKRNSSENVLTRYKNYAYLVVSIMLIISLIRNISRIRKAEERIDRARARVEELEEQRKDLEERLNNTQSEVYLETQLRDGLGYAKEDEIVIVLPEEEILRRIAPDIKKGTVEEPEVANWKKWINLFTTLEE